MDARMIERIWRTAEDGLDPADALTAEEALARVLYLIAADGDVKVEDGYKRDTDLYEKVAPLALDHQQADRWGTPILCLLDWAFGNKRLRRALESTHYISAWR